ncbi:MAG: hypothetical protein CMK00_01015 [Planctomycetes bacterium]|nr:hypothetical protein [Planctomycetota bacterium]
MFHPTLPPAFLFLLFLGFLGTLFLVLAVFLGRARQEGPLLGKLGLGCGAGCCLGCLGFLGLLALAGCLTVLTGSALVRHGPVRSIQIERGAPVVLEPDTPWQRTVHPVHLKLEVRGQVEVEGLKEWLEQETGGEVLFETTSSVEPGGGQRTRLDFWLPVPNGEMRRLERKLRRELPNLGLPSSVTLTLGHDA